MISRRDFLSTALLSGAAFEHTDLGQPFAGGCADPPGNQRAHGIAVVLEAGLPHAEGAGHARR